MRYARGGTLRDRDDGAADGGARRTEEEEEEGEEEGPILCQEMVDPPLLLRGRKFSMRVYVIYIPAEEAGEGDGGEGGGGQRRGGRAYLSSEGLAKSASAPYRDGTTTTAAPAAEGEARGEGGAEEEGEDDDDAYMTNSGRGDGSGEDQMDFRRLRIELERDGGDYDALWCGIARAVRVTMRRYLKSSLDDYDDGDGDDGRGGERHRWHRIASRARLPKILGFDFLPDASGVPWLIEVNRFPGLEPRGDVDAAVKGGIS